MKEGIIQRRIRDMVNLSNIFYCEIVDVKPVLYRGRWIKNQATPGFADLVVLCKLDCRVILIEVKTKTGSQSENQKEFERRWTANRGVYRIVKEPNHLIQTFQILKEHCILYGYRDTFVERFLQNNAA